jgi:hypothetical protein
VVPKTGEAPPQASFPESDEVLRAKYFDYCSAKLADQLLLLSPDEIYLLTEEARRRAGSEESRFTDLVRLATEGIWERLVLPRFEDWAEDYRADPGRYEKYLLVWDMELPDA